jgi:hypothetical protein
VPAQAGLGPERTGPQSERRALSAAQSATSERQAVGHVWPRAKTVFLLFFFQRTVLIVFCSVFEQISYSFFYSNFSNEILIRDLKSYRNISEKFKVNEFYSCFRCK